MAEKNGLVAALDGLPWIVKLILCIPCLDIVWAVYRIVKGLSTNNMLTLIFGILWIFPGAVICWVVDLVCVIIYGQPKVFA